jgi:hypothetical protein
MATSVQILGPDGVLRTSLVFSTTQTTRFFTGTLPDDTVDVEVSLFGQPFTTDPTLVAFQGTGFVIPNPASYPNGLDLFSGDNAIQVRAVFLSGTRSPAATALVHLLPPAESDVFLPPSSVTLERQDGAVTVTVQGLTDTRVVGYNFYAASESGGGAGGYNILNVNRVTVGTPVENTSPLYTLTSNNPRQTADPLYYRAVIDQETESGTVLSTDVDTRTVIDQTVTVIRTVIDVQSVVTTTYYSFKHVRTANPLSTPATVFNGVFASTPATELLYYVVTAVYYDSVTQTEFESYYSTEVVGAPAQVRQQINGITAVSRQQILEDAIATIYRQYPDIAVQPGAVVRDVFLDPYTTEAERLRLLLDYVYRASSFDTLLLVDDPTGSGISTSPANSGYKTALAAALFYANVNDVQNVIDGSFDKIAANFNIFRLPGVGAVGEVRFYTSASPSQTINIPLGTAVQGAGIVFRTTRAATLDVANLASYYNPSTREFSITVPVRASTTGANTNVGTKQLTFSNVYGMSVTNDSPTFGGADQETNAQLAARARTALASVDTGTTQGLLQVAAAVPGTIQNFVVRSGNPLMQRDYDPTLKRHMGGKADVWARGSRPVTATDTFAFTYQKRNDAQFVVIGSPLDYRFRVVGDEVTPSNPLAAMLDYSSLGLGLKNATTGEMFDLTNVTYLNFNTIQLDTTQAQPPVTLTDIVLGDFRFRLGNTHTFIRQPVNEVFSVVGESTGALDLSTISLVHPNSPLGLGCSTKAGDYLEILPSTDPTVVAPSGALITVTDELHLVTGFYVEYLYNLGAEPLSIVVKNQLGTITYKGPFDPSGTPDYIIVEGTSTVAAGIRRTEGSTIPETETETVAISYQYYENFTVTYQSNLVTSVLQQALDDSAHATSDVLAKQAVISPVDISATIILQKGADRATTDIAVRNNLQYLMGKLKLGDPLRRSDVIAEIDGTAGVSYVVVPLTKMVRQAGYQIVRNDLATAALGDAFRVNAWSNSQYAVWLILQELDAPTTTGGGFYNYFRGVFQDDGLLKMSTTAPQNLGLVGGQSYIIGNDGLVIPGYGTGTGLVKNSVLVSLPVGDAPSNHEYWCTYVTAEDTGDKDIDPNSMEFLVLGDLQFTFGEDS